ncbi:hypothetical protein HN843_07790, partial [bacterium]|nr:hypothetical protein [bacterium]
MQQKSFAALLLSLLICLSGVASAAWVSQDTSLPAGPAITAQGHQEILIDIEIPGFEIDTVEIDGKEYSQIVLPGSAHALEKGLPQLPVLSTSVAIPNSGKPQLRIVDSQWSEIEVAPVEPSKGNITRNIDPASVAHEFAPLYSKGGVWPSVQAELGEPFIMRDVRGVSVRTFPFQYDATRGVLRYMTSMTVAVITSGSGGVNSKVGASSSIDSQFEKMYSGYFSNFESNRYATISEPGNLLIVCNDALLSAVSPLVEWKQQKGIATELLPSSSVGGSVLGIQGAITDRYNSPAGLTYVILVGDLAQIPTNNGTYEGALSDPMYTMVEGGDSYPDLFISRISATNPTETQTQVAKFIRYERDPDTGAAGDWYAKATGIASNEGSPTDAERCDLLRDALLGYSFTEVDQIYQGAGGSTAGITAAMNQGRSLVNYIGHGSGTSWSSVSFTNSDVNALDNGWKQPWIIDVACQNGDFNVSACFAETWLRAGSPAAPKGGIASYAASTNAAWVPPCVMQTEIVDLFVADQENTIGALYFYGGMHTLDYYAGNEGLQIIEQYNIFGDCSMVVRSAVPTDIVATHMPVVHLNSPSFDVATGQEGLTVSLYREGVIHGTAVTDVSGNATVLFDVPVVEPGNVTLTITGYNNVPYQVDLMAITPAVVTISPTTIDVLVATDVTVTVMDADGV